MQLQANWEFSQITPQKAIRNPLLLELTTPPQKSTVRQLVVVLAVDRSWSMKGEKMQAVTDAAILFLNWLTRNDVLGIVSYAQDVKVEQNPIPLTEKSTIADKIRRMSLGTSTNLSGGWLTALRLAENYQSPNAVRRVILLTDGQATMGIREEDKLVEIARQYAAKNIVTSTIGVGADFNEQNLKEIARAGGGSFYFMQTPEEASDIFYQEFGAIRSLYAQAAEVRLYFHQPISLNQVLVDADIEKHSDGLTLRLGDIPSDDSRKMVFEFDVGPTNEELMVSGELTFFNVSEDLKEEKIKFNIPLKVGPTQALPNKLVCQEYLLAHSAREIERISLIARQNVEVALNELKNLQHEVKNYLTEKNLELSWLEERLMQMAEKLARDTNLAAKQLLSESTKMYREKTATITKAAAGEILTYKMQSQLDLYKVPEFNEEMNGYLQKGIRFVLIDMQNCPFLDSSAIGALIQLSNSLTKRAGLLIFYNVPTGLQKIIAATRLDKYIPLAPNESEARKLIPME
ncbi:MAG: VWA domain-containing protein [Leptospiraceae bacterium]|nr:VWA domain-containing protein [Leptospiraceae bacterium]MDW8306292.1 VWA domain-containing protein [Leptospiraceae bacterium]